LKLAPTKNRQIYARKIHNYKICECPEKAPKFYKNKLVKVWFMLLLELTMFWIYLMLGNTKARSISRRILGAKYKNLRLLPL